MYDVVRTSESYFYNMKSGCRTFTVFQKLALNELITIWGVELRFNTLYFASRIFENRKASSVISLLLKNT